MVLVGVQPYGTVNTEGLAPEKGAAGSWGRAGRGEPGLGDGEGGDVTGVANSLPMLCSQREVAVAGAARGSPSEIQTFGSACDWRLTKR